MSDNTNFQEYFQAVQKDLEKRAKEAGGLTPNQEKQVLKEIVREKFAPPIPTGSTPAASSQSQGDSTTVLPKSTEPSHEDLIRQYQPIVDKFIQEALAQDLNRVVQRVNRSNNPWVIDQFHDVLVDKF